MLLRNKLILFSIITLILFLIPILLGDANAESRRRERRPARACSWSGSNLVCNALPFSTGCIELKNVSGKKVGFLVWKPGMTSAAPKGTIHVHILQPGQSKKADFQGHFEINNCIAKRKDGQDWDWVSCYNVFDRGKDVNYGGGCGCQMFGCLPTEQVNEQNIH